MESGQSNRKRNLNKVTRRQHSDVNDPFGIIDFILTDCYCEHYGIGEHC